MSFAPVLLFYIFWHIGALESNLLTQNKILGSFEVQCWGGWDSQTIADSHEDETAWLVLTAMHSSGAQLFFTLMFQA